MQRHGWVLLFHDCIIQQLRRLQHASERALHKNPKDAKSNANVKLFSAISRLVFETIPTDPNHERYKQGNTLGSAHRHWRRAKIGSRFRLFFRYDTRTKIIIYAWVNDKNSLRAEGSLTDPYATFKRIPQQVSKLDRVAFLAADRAAFQSRQSVDVKGVAAGLAHLDDNSVINRQFVSELINKGTTSAPSRKR